MRAELGWLVLALGAPGCSEGTPPPHVPPLPSAAALARLDPAVARRLEAARAAVESAPQDGRAWGELGRISQAADLPAVALEAYAEAERLEPAEPRWPYYAAMAHELLGQLDQALAGYRRALERPGPVHPPTHWRIGNLLLARFDLDQAEAAFGAATEADPGDLAGWCGLARVELARDEPEQALELLQRAAAVAPGARYVRALRGDALRRVGRWDEAKVELEAAGDAAPVFPDPWERELYEQNADSFQKRFTRATTLLENGLVVESIEPLEALARDEPENRTVLKALADASSRAGRASRAREVLERLLALEPDDRQTLVLWIEHCLREGDDRHARASLDRLLALHPEDGQAHFYDGVLLERAGRPAEALEAYRRSLYHDRRNPGTWMAIARLELDARRWAAAREAFEEARAQGLERSELELGLAQACLMLDDASAAAQALERARALPGTDQRALARLQRELDERDGGAR